MKCPICGAPDSKVLDSRPIEEDNSIKRRRECQACGRRFTTYEMVSNEPLIVIKKDGTREFFDPHKLHTGLMLACSKRPVDTKGIVDSIAAELNASLQTEVTSTEIGQMVMEKLRETDEISYVRFASVYREFKDVDTFMEALRSVRPKKRTARKK